MTMQIIPAIDIRDGRCVRLYQGDFAQTTTYSEDPVAVAQRWAAAGASRLHVVDLDGARQGHPVNTDVIEAIVQAVAIPVQLGGGLRREADILAALELGVARVILGTAALRDAEMVATLAGRLGEQLIVGVDARNGQVAVEAWTDTSQMQASVLIARMADLGVTRFIYTDIARDGTLAGPNFAALRDLIRPDGPAIIASGGIAGIEHLGALTRIGVEGAIIGKALYTGDIDLAAAIAAVA
jgi:phosphoribosylformimino-5-aminoimidazole carboxamide ribotide isomerase